MPKQVILITVYILFQLAAIPASGWGWEAHKLICALAEEQLTPDARNKVNQWLSESEKLKGGVTDFPQACLWPDDVKYTTRKDTYEHHFINVPNKADSVRLDRDCAATDCLATGIQQSLNYLSRQPDGQRSVTRRAAALRFLGHYIADLHQPLHVGNASDWGGNKISVTWRGENTNLHALWDYEMPEAAGLKYPQSLTYLEGTRPKLDNSIIHAWLNESLRLARSHAYVDLHDRQLTSGATISEEYFERSKPIIIERIRIAAARIAGLLNQIAKGQQPVAFKLVPVQS